MTTAVVDPAAVVANFRLVSGLTAPGTAVMAVIKADAYGHGAAVIAPALERAGVTRFAVATAGELLAARAAGVTGDILLLTPALTHLPELLAADAGFMLTDFPALGRLLQAGAPRGTRVHVKVDTGMGRLGVGPSEAARLAEAAARAGFELEGICTHFAAAENDRALTAAQLERFLLAVELLKLRGLEARFRHAANSAAILRHPEAHLDLVRPGLLLYGYSPVPDAALPGGRLVPALRLEAPVLSRKLVHAGQGLSYDQTWRAPETVHVCTVRCGYADGYRRSLSNLARATWNGHVLKQRGRIAMDQMLFQVPADGPGPGDTVVLFGGDGPGADELGALAGTNAYDLLTSLTSRVPRRYVGTDD